MKTDDKITMFKPYVNVEGAMTRLRSVLESGWIGEGPKVKAFERELQARFGYPHVLALNSGTSGLRLALALAGVGPGDEVITTAQTCSASNTPILEQFATPVFADVQYLTGNIDPLDIEHRITEKTKAIMVVHWAGYPCDMDEIGAIARRHNLPVIEDGAHALGAEYHGKAIGTISDYTMFSLQAIKHLTTGDGGLLTLLNEDKYHEGRRRRWFGIDRDNRTMREDGYMFWDQVEPGYKYQMNDIAAAVGLANLEWLSLIMLQRSLMAGYYRERLDGVPGVTLFDHRADRKSADWLFTMHVERRDDFCRMMRSKDIEVSVVHIRNDVHGVFGGRREDLPMLDKYEKTHISIPLHNHLSSDDIHRVTEAIRGGW